MLSYNCPLDRNGGVVEVKETFIGLFFFSKVDNGVVKIAYLDMTTGQKQLKGRWTINQNINR